MHDVVKAEPGQIGSLRNALMHHQIYAEVNSIERLKLFMEDHVFAVWDFMSLLKRLQQDLTCVRVPWFPSKDPHAARLINEIVIAEESDLGPDEAPISHLGLYLEAMEEIGADTTAFRKFRALAEKGRPIAQCLEEVEVLPHVRSFVNHTVELAENGTTEEVMGAFLHGREDVIPDMFERIRSTMLGNLPQIPKFFHHYIDRHIELDGDSHGPLAEALLSRLVLGAPEKLTRANVAASASLDQRINLWDGTLKKIQPSHSHPMPVGTGKPIWQSQPIPPSSTARFDISLERGPASASNASVETIIQFLESYPLLAELFINIHLTDIDGDAIQRYAQLIQSCLALKFGHTNGVPRIRLFVPFAQISDALATELDRMNTKSDALEVVVVLNVASGPLVRSEITSKFLEITARLSRQNIPHTVLIEATHSDGDFESIVFLLRALSASRPAGSDTNLVFEHALGTKLTPALRTKLYQGLLDNLIFLSQHLDDGSRTSCGYMGIVRTQMRLAGIGPRKPKDGQASPSLWCSPHRSMSFWIWPDGSTSTCGLARSTAFSCVQNGTGSEHHLFVDAFNEYVRRTDVLARVGTRLSGVNILSRMEDYVRD